MTVKSGQVITTLFTVKHPTTQLPADADSLPIGALYINGALDAAVVTVTRLSLGLYKVAVTLPSLTAGDIASLHVQVSVATAPGQGIIWQDVSDTRRLSDLVNLSAAEAAAAVLALVYEDAETFQSYLRLTRAVLLGKSANAGADYRDLADTKDRVNATLDENGNRTAVTTDAT